MDLYKYMLLIEGLHIVLRVIDTACKMLFSVFYRSDIEPTER